MRRKERDDPNPALPQSGVFRNPSLLCWNATNIPVGALGLSPRAGGTRGCPPNPYPNPYPNPRLPHPACFSPNTMQDRTASSPWAAPGRTPAENRDVCSILGGLARRGGPLCSLCPPLQLPAEGQGDEGGWGMKEVGSAASPPRVIKGESAARGWLLFIS